MSDEKEKAKAKAKGTESEADEGDEGDDADSVGSGGSGPAWQPKPKVEVGVLASSVEDRLATSEAKATSDEPSEIDPSMPMDPVVTSAAVESAFLAVAQPIVFGDVTEQQYQKMYKFLTGLQRKQLVNSKFDCSNIIHRYPNLPPYEFNTMRDYVGSWVGDYLGMTQWPIDTRSYYPIIRKTIVENDVALIVALGPQEEKERIAMFAYWEKLGGRSKLLENTDQIERYLVEEIDPDASAENNKEGNKNNTTDQEATKPSLEVLRIPQWADFTAPSESLIGAFETVFTRIQDLAAAGKRTLIHCKAGVGRSGTFYLMYRAWLGKVTQANFFREWLRLRLLRVETIQTHTQLNFAMNYVLLLERKNEAAKTNLEPDKRENASQVPPPATVTSVDQVPPPPTGLQVSSTFQPSFGPPIQKSPSAPQRQPPPVPKTPEQIVPSGQQQDRHAPPQRLPPQRPQPAVPSQQPQQALQLQQQQPQQPQPQQPQQRQNQSLQPQHPQSQYQSYPQSQYQPQHPQSPYQQSPYQQPQPYPQPQYQQRQPYPQSQYQHQPYPQQNKFDQFNYGRSAFASPYNSPAPAFQPTQHRSSSYNAAPSTERLYTPERRSGSHNANPNSMSSMRNPRGSSLGESPALRIHGWLPQTPSPGPTFPNPSPMSDQDSKSFVRSPYRPDQPFKSRHWIVRSRG